MTDFQMDDRSDLVDADEVREEEIMQDFLVDTEGDEPPGLVDDEEMLSSLQNPPSESIMSMMLANSGTEINPSQTNFSCKPQ